MVNRVRDQLLAHSMYKYHPNIDIAIHKIALGGTHICYVAYLYVGERLTCITTGIDEVQLVYASFQTLLDTEIGTR